RGHAQFVLGPAAADRIGLIEARDVAADDLLGGITVHLLGAGIPRGDPSLHVDHEDGVVLHVGDEAAETLLALAQRVFVRAPLGEIARHLGEAQPLPLRAAARSDHHAGPERGAVLAHAAAFVLENTLLGGLLQFVLREAAVHLLRRIEAREMRADDFLGPVALDGLRAGIPGDHIARRVEHEDGVVLDRRDQLAVDPVAIGSDAAARRVVTAVAVAAAGAVARAVAVPCSAAARSATVAATSESRSEQCASRPDCRSGSNPCTAKRRAPRVVLVPSTDGGG